MPKFVGISSWPNIHLGIRDTPCEFTDIRIISGMKSTSGTPAIVICRRGGIRLGSRINSFTLTSQYIILHYSISFQSESCKSLITWAHSALLMDMGVICIVEELGEFCFDGISYDMRIDWCGSRSRDSLVYR